jgi:hypothetical protein
MPIVSPQLDDLTYDRVVAELTRRIPVYSPEWTNYNDSDPGYTLIQLFAYLAEMVGYRLNQIPEKNQIALLQLLGIKLNPAKAATTRLALLLQDPTTVVSTTLPVGASGKATAGSPPPAFQTTTTIDIIPAQCVLLLTTIGPDLRDLRLLADGTRDTTTLSLPTSHWLTVTWDGNTPNLKDMPLAPVTLAPVDEQRFVWVGIDFNTAISAGFLSVQVTLTIQFDDDEQPTLTVSERCGPQAPAAQVGKANDWFWYFDAQATDVADSFKLVPGQFIDTTDQLSHSGTITFTVPTTLGPIPAIEFLNLSGKEPSGPTPVDICLSLANNISAGVSGLTMPTPTDSGSVATWIKSYSSALQIAIATTVNSPPTNPSPVVPHPLNAKQQATMAWFRMDLRAAPAAPLSTAKLRMITFNGVPAANSTTVTNELVGVADGTPGQTYSLANQNVQPGTLVVNVQESPASDPQPLVSWTVVASLDAAEPNDRQVALDPEAGVLTFGDGIHGMIAPLVPGGGQIVALQYAWGGGETGNVGVATITTLNSSAAGVSGVVNFVSATGGRDPETLADAEIRARMELSTRSRAVTAGDFQWIATQTPTVEVALAEVVPLRRPLGSHSTIVPVTSAPCGTAVPTTPAGLESTDSAGVVSVIVVPNETGPEPTPTPSFLQAVCDYLDPHRLVTTEVYVVPPQFARLCNLKVSVKGQPGYTRDQLQVLVSTQLATYLHVLTGGDDGTGYPFGNQLHIADLIAQVYRVAGVDRVDALTTDFVRTKSDASPRQGSLTLCPASSTQYTFIQLAPEETVSFNADTFLLSTVT